MKYGDKRKINNRKIFEMGREFLLSFEQIDNKILKKHLNYWKHGKRNSMNEILLGMLKSASNRRNMGKTIGNVEGLRFVLLDFKPSQIIAKYGADYKSLFDEIESLLVEKSKKPKMNVDNPKSFWVIFCKTILSAANFLSKFQTIADFHNFVLDFYLKDYTRIALPLVLEKEIYGLGFATACDFLKENGYPKYVKPDTHIKSIFKGIRLSSIDSTDYDIFKDVVNFAEKINKLPYVVDKLFWLIGSGEFYLEKPKIRIGENRDNFIKLVNLKMFNHK